MNLPSRRITALSLILLMLMSLCACSMRERLNEESVRQTGERCTSDFERLYANLTASFSDIVSESDFAKGKAELDGICSKYTGVEKASQEEYKSYIDEIQSAYDIAACRLAAPVLCDINSRYAQYYQTLFGECGELVSFSDALGSEISDVRDFDQMKKLAYSLGDRYFDSAKCDLTPENIDKIAVKAYLSQEKDSTIVLIGNFRMPRIREENNAFALDFYSSAKGAQFAYPDTLYAYDAISYPGGNVAEIDMSKVLSGCEFTDLFKAYKRITFILFAIDNSFTKEIDLSALRSDDYLPEPPDARLHSLQTALDL